MSDLENVLIENCRGGFLVFIVDIDKESHMSFVCQLDIRFEL